MPELTCRRCGETWFPDALGADACPRCLLGLGLDTTADDVTQPAAEETREFDVQAIGHYVVLSELGQGGAGRVFLAQDQDIPGRRVALKVLKPEGPLPNIETMRREASALAALQHPHILVVHEIGSSLLGPFLATEYLPGGTLADRLRPALPLSTALRYAREIADAVALAHSKGIVHRDIKPANLLFTEDGTLKVADFGLAFTVRGAGGSDDDAATASPTNRAAWSGTPGYVAPEVLGGASPGPPADQFSFGVTLHELLAGSRPHGDGDWREATLSGRKTIDPSIPVDLAGIIRRCIATDPPARYERMEHVVEALDAAVRRRDPRRRRTFLLAAAGLTAVLAVIAIWQGGQLLQSRRARLLHADGIRALDEGRRADALQAFIGAHRADPGFLPACVALGKLAPEEMALAYLKECRSAFPDSQRVLYNLGQSLALNGKSDEAESVLRDAMAKNTDATLTPLLSNELALVLLDLGRANDAVSLLDPAAFPPSDTLEGAVLHKTLGLALLADDREADAAEQLRLALAGPLAGEIRTIALVGLGQALEKHGDAGSARAAYAEALLDSIGSKSESEAREGLRRVQQAGDAR